MFHITVRRGTLLDIEEWIKLVVKVSPLFPGLETCEAIAEHKNTVLEFMGRGEALCVKDGVKVVGVLLYSRKHNMLCCLAVDSDYRKLGIASALILEALRNLDRSRNITATSQNYYLVVLFASP
ncbi:MAG: GNAT family N-acetyltransferase [Lachnospiraceae bacterium]|nr:GNAT family N-acetyltransferase [Lachnospiraceae bacterium]